MIKFLLLLFGLLSIHLSCLERIEKTIPQNLEYIVERIPRYKDFVIDSDNQIDYFFERFHVKKESEIIEKDKKTEIRKIAKGKYKNLDFTVRSYISEGKVRSTQVTFYFPPSKKIKSFEINHKNNSYIESNDCSEFSSVYSPVQTKVPAKLGNFQCGRELSFNADLQTVNEVCWDVKNQYQVDDCRDRASFDFKTQQKSFPRDRNTCPRKCYEFIPYLNSGIYIVRKSEVNLRKEPNRNSQLMGKLKLDEEIEVIEDTGPIEELDENIAPWVKIKTKLGIEGYVFGIFLKKPKEFWN
jgi:hypothetical protein